MILARTVSKLRCIFSIALSFAVFVGCLGAMDAGTAVEVALDETEAVGALGLAGIANEDGKPGNRSEKDRITEHKCVLAVKMKVGERQNELDLEKVRRLKDFCLRTKLRPNRKKKRSLMSLRDKTCCVFCEENVMFPNRGFSINGVLKVVW